MSTKTEYTHCHIEYSRDIAMCKSANLKINLTVSIRQDTSNSVGIVHIMYGEDTSPLDRSIWEKEEYTKEVKFKISLSEALSLSDSFLLARNCAQPGRSGVIDGSWSRLTISKDHEFRDARTNFSWQNRIPNELEVLRAPIDQLLAYAEQHKET